MSAYADLIERLRTEAMPLRRRAYDTAMEAADAISRLEREKAILRDALERIADMPGEINLSNYGPEDVEFLNGSHIESFLIAMEALSRTQGLRR